MTEAPTTQERYSRAVQSSNLRVQGEHVPGDADYLIAAGLSKANFGKLLMRLQSDWDSSSRRIPRRPTRRDIARAAQISMRKGITKVTKDSSKAARQRLEAAYKSEVAMLSASMRSLPAVRLHLSTKLLLDGMSDEDVTQIVLGWLEPICPFCQGRKMQLKKWSEVDLSDQACGGCEGTGSRPVASEVEQAARHYMDECMADARQGIGRKVHQPH